MKASRFAPEVPNSVAAAAAFESLRTYALLESLRAYEAPYGAIVDAFDEGDYFAFDAEWAASSAALRAACASSKTVARIENARTAAYAAHDLLAQIDDAAYAAHTVGVSVPENLRRAVLYVMSVRGDAEPGPLFRTRTGEHYTGSGWRANWQRAMHRAVADGVLAASFTDHDIRAKAAADARAQGLDPSALLGHSDPRVTSRHYLRGPAVVRPVDAKKPGGAE